MTAIEATNIPNPFDVAETEPVTNVTLLEGVDHLLEEEKTPNFPIFHPIIYHDIEKDIPTQHILRIKLACFLTLTMSSNSIIQLLIFCVSTFLKDEQLMAGQNIFLSLIWNFNISGFLFLVYYIPLYEALRDHNKINNTGFMQLFVFLFQIFNFLGYSGTGTIGILSSRLFYFSEHAGGFIKLFMFFFVTIVNALNVINSIVGLALVSIMVTEYLNSKKSPEILEI